MARILVVSSQVASGHVGLSAIQPALQCLGHEVLALPTILLSNHPGRQPASGSRIEPDVLDRMVDTLVGNGRLGGIDAVLSGYLPSAAHVAVVGRTVAKLRAAGSTALYLCDPVIGDDPKGLYIDPGAAAAIRDTLVPLADVVTPNRFELAWLTGQAVSDAPTATVAARLLQRSRVVVTSVPSGAAHLATVSVTAAGVHARLVDRRATAPNGTGDLFSALYLSALLEPAADDARALAAAVAGVDQVLANSGGRDELALIATLRQWRGTPQPAMDTIPQLPL